MKGFNFLGKVDLSGVNAFGWLRYLVVLLSFLTFFFLIPSAFIGSMNTVYTVGWDISFDNNKVLSVLWLSWAGLASVLVPVVASVSLIGVMRESKGVSNKGRIAVVVFILAVISYILLRTLYVLNDSNFEWALYMLRSAWGTYCSVVGIPAIVLFCSYWFIKTNKRNSRTIKDSEN